MYELGTLPNNDYDGITGVATGVTTTTSYGFFKVEDKVLRLNIVSTGYSAWFNGCGNISK